MRGCDLVDEFLATHSHQSGQTLRQSKVCKANFECLSKHQGQPALVRAVQFVVPAGRPLSRLTAASACRRYVLILRFNRRRAVVSCRQAGTMARLAARRASLWWPCRSPRNDQPLTRSGLEGSSRSGDIVCRGVAGGVASKFKVLPKAKPVSSTSAQHSGAA